LFIVLVVGLVIGLPIAVALGIGTLAAIHAAGNLPIALVAQRMFVANSSVSMMAVPFFMLAGSIMTAGGISKRLIKFSNTLIGWITGGLGLVATLTACFFAAISGSSSATAAAVGGTLIPEMEKEGYDPEFSASVVAAASTTGIVIPPSVSMVLYAVAAGVSVGTLFIAGFLPGILMGLAVALVLHHQAKKKHYPVSRKSTFKEITRAFGESVWGLLTPVIIIGGIYGGIFTATEAAAASCVYALIVSCFIYKELKLKDIPAIFMDSVKATAVVMFVMNAAGLFSWMITAYRVPEMVTNAFTSITDNKYIMLMLVNILLLIVGTFLNASSAVIILAPILVPLLSAMGVDKVLLGIIIVVNLAIGCITPPVGVSLFVVQSISKLPFVIICKNIIPYIIALIVALILITYIPMISLGLPMLIGGYVPK
jgi:C4-dicarboxylate transporter DctM subunit